MIDVSMGNIQRVVPVDVSTEDFVDEQGFFIRVETEGLLRYCPINNKTDAEAITKYFYGSTIFVDPEVCRKIFASAGIFVSPESSADNIYVGYGV